MSNFFNKCVLYSEKNDQIHIMTLSYYSNKSIFFIADCVRSKHEKHSQDSPENCRVRTIRICQGKCNSTYLTTTLIHFDYKILKYVWTPHFSFAWKIKSMVILTMFSLHVIKTCSIMKRVLNAKIVPIRTKYLTQNTCRYDSSWVQSADIVLEKKD